MLNEYLILLISVTIFLVIADAISQAVIQRKDGVSYYDYHLPRWISFYTPYIIIYGYIYFVYYHTFYYLVFIASFAILCKVVWKVFYETIRKSL